MTISRDILLALLKLTQMGSVRKDSVQKDSRMPSQVLNRDLSELSRNDLIEENDGSIEVSPSQRIRIAFLALQAGADLKQVCALLSWSEFEKIAADAFELNGYEVIRNLHFKHASRRWEIDVVALRKPAIICADCKHWKHGWREAAAVKAAEAQIERTGAFAQALASYRQKVKLEKWQTARLIPIILSLEAGPIKFYSGVPIVPVLQLQDFINELPAHGHLLKSFYQNKLVVSQDLREFIK